MHYRLRRWLAFCDAEGRQSLLAEKGDVLAYIGYLSLEVREDPRPARQYVTTVSSYHEDAGFQMSTKTAFVSRLIKAYAAHGETARERKTAQAGMDAVLARKVLQLVLITSD